MLKNSKNPCKNLSV